MSIATELQNLNDNILDAYTAVQGKGGTVPANKNMTNLGSAIASIPSGGGVGIPREVNASGVCGPPTQSFTFSLPANATSASSNAFRYALYGCTGLTAVDLSSITSITGGYDVFGFAFYGCTNLASVNLSSLTDIGASRVFQNAFEGCTSLSTLSFPALTASSFGSNTDQFFKMLRGVTGCTVHFPAAIQSTIGSWRDVTNGFGGTNTTVLFDL